MIQKSPNLDGPVWDPFSAWEPLLGPFGAPTGPGGPLAPGSGPFGAARLAYASMPVERSGGTDRTELVELMYYVFTLLGLFTWYEFVRRYRRYETRKLFSADVTKWS